MVKKILFFLSVLMLFSTANAQWTSQFNNAWWSNTEDAINRWFPTGRDSASTLLIVGGSGDTVQVRGKFYFWRTNRYVPEDSLYTIAQIAAAYQPLETTLTDIADGTIDENLVNTANPWAENEIDSTMATKTNVSDSIAAHTVEGTANNQFMHYDLGNGWTALSASVTGDSLFKAYTNLPTATTIGTAYIYRVGGTDVTDADVADNITITNISQVGDITATAAEINYTTDVTSNIQAQFKGKADTLAYHWGVMDTVTVGDLIAYKVESNITIIKVSTYGTTDSVRFNIQERAATPPNTAGDSLFASLSCILNLTLSVVP